MSEMEEKLGSLLNNPQLMQQIMSMAQSLGGPPPPPQDPKPEDTSPIFDPTLLQSLSKMAGQNHIDGNQQALLNALCPYLSRQRVNKLERAMRAARLAGAASSFLNAGGLQMLSGR
jgi:hypothetical protein